MSQQFYFQSIFLLSSVFNQFQVWAIGYQDRKLYFRTGVSYTELSGRSWKLIDLPNKRNIDEDTDSLSESLSSLDSSLSGQQKTTTNHLEGPATQRSIRSVTMPSNMAPSLTKSGNDVVLESYMHEIAGQVVRTIAIQTDPPQRPQSVMPSGVEYLLADQLKGFPRNGTTQLSNMHPNIPDPSTTPGADNKSKESMQNSEGLTLEEVEAEVKEAAKSREGSWSSNYSDTIVNFVFDGDDSIEPVQFLDAECSKGTQTDWKDEELMRLQMEELEALELANTAIITKCNEKEQEAWDANTQCNESCLSSPESHDLNNQLNDRTQDNQSSIHSGSGGSFTTLDAQSLSSEGGIMFNVDDTVSRISSEGTQAGSDVTSLLSDIEIEGDLPSYRELTLSDTSSIQSVQSADRSQLHHHHDHHHHHHSEMGCNNVPVDKRLSLLQMTEGRFHRSASEPMIDAR